MSAGCVHDAKIAMQKAYRVVRMKRDDLHPPLFKIKFRD